MKLPTFFLKRQTKERVLKVNKSEITGENKFNGDHFEMNQVKTEKLCFGYFYRFVTSDLALRTRNTYIYVFGALFGFCNC